MWEFILSCTSTAKVDSGFDQFSSVLITNQSIVTGIFQS